MSRPGPGKFEGNESLEVSEYLYDIIGDSMQDDEIGDVESFGWHALITDIPSFRSTLDPLQNELYEMKNVEFQPAYIVLEDNDGFFTYRGFDSNDEARQTWSEIVQIYLHGTDNSDGVSVI